MRFLRQVDSNERTLVLSLHILLLSRALLRDRFFSFFFGAFCAQFTIYAHVHATMSALKCSHLKVLSHQSLRHQSALYGKGRDLSTDKTFNFEFDFNCCHHVASSTRINTFWVNKRMWRVDRIEHVHVSIFNFPFMQQRPQPSPVVQIDDWRDDIKNSHNFQQEIWLVTIKSSSIVSSTQQNYDVFLLTSYR